MLFVNRAVEQNIWRCVQKVPGRFGGGGVLALLRLRTPLPRGDDVNNGPLIEASQKISKSAGAHADANGQADDDAIRPPWRFIEKPPR